MTYNIDPINRTSIIDNGTTSGYTVSALNQYLTAGNQSFGYDNNFNLTSGTNPSLSMTYDAENHLLSMSAAGGSGQFVYDGFGRCVKRTVGVRDGVVSKHLTFKSVLVQVEPIDFPSGLPVPLRLHPAQPAR